MLGNFLNIDETAVYSLFQSETITWVFGVIIGVTILFIGRWDPDILPSTCWVQKIAYVIKSAKT